MTHDPPIWVNLVTPHRGGTFSVHRMLRTGLAALGVDLQWWCGGRREAEALRQRMAEHPSDLEPETRHGRVLGDTAEADEQIAAAYLAAIAEVRPACVLINVLAGALEANLARYLPAEVTRIVIVHNMTPGTYRFARAVRDHVHAAICVSPRIRDDLVAGHGFAAERTFTVANAVDLDLYRRPRPPRGGPPRLLSLGRIEDHSKGVLWLPGIARAVRRQGVEARLTIAGQGPDLERLQAAVTPDCGDVRFLGSVAYEQVPALMAEHDVFLLPSRFEGLPCTLVEAMAAGCVPVASHIAGCTDFVITAGQDGLLFPLGDLTAAAAQVAALARDPALLARMSAAARATAARRFSAQAQAQAYCRIVAQVTAEPRPLTPPLPLSQWRYPRALTSGWRSRLPRPLVNTLRTLMERWRTRRG